MLAEMQVGEEIMNPSDIYSNTLSVLTDARTAMLSSAWQTALDGESQAVRVAAGNELIKLQGAILALSNELLSDIAAQMQANEAGLTQCTTDLTNALKNITNVQNVMTTVTNILTVVAKVVPLL
jgi:hypothetical protein